MTEKFKLITDETRARMRVAANPESAGEIIATQQAERDIKSAEVSYLGGPQKPSIDSLASHKMGSDPTWKPLR